MAERKVQELLCQMQKTLECSICLELMTNPVSTPCGHQFCRFCLMEFLERKRQVPCPLCKKVITKRSLIDRSQLGEMVTCVKTLVAAFQADTGSLFSPPRGPAASVLPGTPETIQSKCPRKTPSTGRSNVRRSSRKQSYDHLDEVDGSPADNQSRNAAEENVGLEKRYPQRGGTAKDQITDSMVLRQQELLKQIEEGTHYAKESVEDSVEKLTSCGTDENSTSGIETTYSDESCKNVSVQRQVTKDLQRNQSLLGMEDESLLVINKQINGDNDLKIKTYVRKTDTVNANNKEIMSEFNTDKGDDILSGTSVGILSEASSGPLFKSPVEKEKQEKKKSAFEALQFESNNEIKRSLRSREKRISYSETDGAEFDKNVETTDLLATQDPLVVKEMVVQQTYSRKHKEVHEKNKKTTKKVEDWLKNIPEDTSNKKEMDRIGKSNVEQQDNKTKKNAKLSKRKLKILEEEKAMGMKLKHLALQVSDKPKGLLFDFDEFDNDSSTKESTGKDLNEKKNFKTNNFEEKHVSETNREYCLTYQKNDTKNCEKTNSMTVSEEDKTVCKEIKATSNNALLEVGTNDSLSETGKTGSETDRIGMSNRKRIFKTKGIVAKQTVCVNNVQVDSKKIETTRNEEEKDELLKNLNEKNLCPQDMKEFEMPNSESDPYEFKSSQNTPKKVKKNKRNPKKKNINGNSKKNSTALEELEVENGNNLKINEKTWNKDMVPDKTILKNSKEINTIQANLKEAEEYDLVTCTQEAAAHIAQEQKKQGTRKSDPTGTMFKEGIKSDCARKRVRFSEPVIADFMKPGRIDLLAYRKAKEQFNATACNSSQENKQQQREDELQNKENENVKGNKVVEEVILSAEEDSESDDLSEDYRFHDNSSGTDDLEIEPTQEQFEKPNIEIQPDEIKARLSQELSQQLILETPVIPVNKDSPEVTIIEETPALFAVPKFNRSLSKSGHKSNNSEWKGKNVSSVQFNTDAKVDTTASSEKPQLNNTKEGHKQLKTRGNVKANTGVKTPEIVPAVTVIAETPLLQNMEHESENIDLDSSVMDTDTAYQKSELGIPMKAKGCSKGNEIDLGNESLPACEKNQVNNFSDLKKASSSPLDSDETQSPDDKIIEAVDTEDPAIKESPQNLVSSEQTLSQDSESLLHPRVSPAKQTGNSVTRKGSSIKGLLPENENVDKVEKTISTEHADDSGETKSVKTDNESTLKTKKKRKSFMLEEEESLDFGSLSKNMAVDIKEDKQGSAKKAKRQRLDRHGSSRYKNERLQLKKVSGSIGPIDSLNLASKNGDEISKYIGKSDDEKIVSADAIPDTVYLVSDEVDFTHESGNNGLDLDVAPSVEIISPESVELMEKTEKKSVNSDHNSHHSELNKSLEFTNPADKTDKLLTNRLKNKNKKGKEGVKPQMSHANHSGLETANSPVEEDDITRIRHLSGLLVSPSSQGLSTHKGSPENIFEMDSVLPSVDFSPVDNVDKPGSISPSLDLELLSNMESVDEFAVANKIDCKTVGASEHRIKDNKKDEWVVTLTEQDSDKVKSKFTCTSGKTLAKNDTVRPKKEFENEVHGEGSDSSLSKKSKVKAVRGFAKKNRMSGLSPGVPSASGPSSDGSVISETPLFLDSTKQKSPVSKIASPFNRSQSRVQHTPESVCILDSKVNTVETEMDIDTNLADTSQKNLQKVVKNSNHKKNNLASVKSKEINATKYSPMLRKQRKQAIEEKCKEFVSEVVDLKTCNSDDEDDVCILSPNELPDLDDLRGKTPDKVKSHVDTMETTSPHRNTGRSKSRFPTVSDQKENVTNKVENDSEQGIRTKNTVEEQNTIPETVSQIESDFEMLSPPRIGMGSEIPELTDGSQCNINEPHIEVDEADNSIHSSTSSEFRLESSEDEESPEKQAVNVISKFDKIVQNVSGYHIDDKKGDEMNDKPSTSKKKHGKGNEISKHGHIERIERNHSKKLSAQMNMKDKQTEIVASGEKKLVIPESEDIYSSRLDSSPLSSPGNHDTKTESEAVIMESDIEEDVEIPSKCSARKIRNGNIVEDEHFKSHAREVDEDDHETSKKEMRKSSKVKGKDNMYAATDSDSDEDTDGRRKGVNKMYAAIDSESDEDTDGRSKELNNMYAAIDSDSDDEEETVVRRKGIKRAILSDSSSEEEDDSSRQNLTSSSAFSSQSENLTTQERIALEKEVERMAREMELMKEQLKRNKQLNAEKKRAAVVLDDSDEDHIDDDHSDVEMEQDLFMSQPSMDLHDTPPQQAETVSGSVDETEMQVDSDDETIQPSNIAETLPPEVTTVPESEPSQSLRNIESFAATDLEPSQSVQPTPDETVETSKCVQPSPDNTIEPSTLEHLSQDNTVKPSESMQDTEMSKALVRPTLSQQLAKPALPFLESVAKPSPVHNMKSRFSQAGKSVLGESGKLAEGDSRRTQDSTRPVLGEVDTNTKIVSSSSVLLDGKPSPSVSNPVPMQKDSSEVDKNVGESPKPGSKKSVGIVVTGLNQSQVQQTKKLVVLNEAKFFSKFNNFVTHVVVKPSEEDDLICDRTLKFFQGIAKKCWIVNYFWVSDSREVGYLLPEGPYEIQGDTANNESHFGPKRSRCAIGDKLFDKFEVALIGDNEFLSKDSLQDLIETCGGRVLDIAHVGQGNSSTHRGQGQRVAMVISCTDLEEGDEEQDLIVRQSRDIYNGLGLVTVTREWVLDSLTMYRIQPLEDYVITDIANLKLPKI